jgi:mercuric ion binding protein
MKNTVLALFLWFAVTIGLSFATGCRRSDTSAVPSRSASGVNAASVTIPIEGMVCASCVARTKRALKSVDGVEEVELSLEKRQARVRYDSSKTSPDRLAATIRELGYEAGTPTEDTR